MKSATIKFGILTFGIMLISSCSGNGNVSNNAASKNGSSEKYPLNRGAYSSVEYLKFKEEKLSNNQLSASNQHSEKIKFKEFVKHKKQSEK